MTLHELGERLDALKAEHNYPTMVLVMSQYCSSRGFIPVRGTMNEMIINFFQGELGLHSLEYEFNMPILVAKSFMADLRHLERFKGI